MKKSALIIALLFLSSHSFAQKENLIREKEVSETIEWLNIKFIEHQFSSDGTTQIHTFKEISEINGVNYLTGIHTQETNKPWRFSRIFIIPIDKINSISFIDMPSNIWMEIRMKNNEDDIILYNEKAEATSVNSYAFMLNNSIDNEKLRPRIKKSIEHLMELYGNKTKEKF